MVTLFSRCVFITDELFRKLFHDSLNELFHVSGDENGPCLFLVYYTFVYYIIFSISLIGDAIFLKYEVISIVGTFVPSFVIDIRLFHHILLTQASL